MIRLLQRVLAVTGVILLVVVAVTKISGLIGSRRAIAQFKAEVANGGMQQPRLRNYRDPDFSLWSEKRSAAYRASLVSDSSQPVALLRIERLGMEVPVFPGTDETVLNRGAGWIDGTPGPGEPGNSGIAAHRDGFFRALKDVSVGDTIEIVTARATKAYAISEIRIVDPTDVSVLRARSAPSSITLVTCYPFYFVGDAPQRYIVLADLVSPSASSNQLSESKGFDGKKGE